jgi:hypothetical protein
MAHSEHTDKEWLQAARNMPRGADGAIVYPPVISRKPRRGDVHPVSPAALRERMPGIRPEYLYGLRRIELRSRRSNRIGEPFGCYLFRERVVVLYSLPLVWTLDGLSNGWKEQLTAYHAEVHKEDKDIHVSWPSDTLLDLWFWDQVFIHELGHHFVEQYKERNGRVRRRSAHEGLANLHVGRYLNRRMRRLRSQKLESADGQE